MGKEGEGKKGWCQVSGDYTLEGEGEGEGEGERRKLGSEWETVEIETSEAPENERVGGGQSLALTFDKMDMI